MFFRVYGKESVNVLAEQIGCKAGEVLAARGGSDYGKPALAGNTFGIKEKIKAAGGRWDGAEKAWTFQSWGALENFLLVVIKE